MIKKFSYLDFESSKDGLSDYLTTIGDFSMIEIKPLSHSVKDNEVCVEIEKELIKMSKFKIKFPHVTIIDDENILFGNCRLIVS